MADVADLQAWGWNAHCAVSLTALTPRPKGSPARVVGQDRDRWTVRLASGIAVARITGASFPGPVPVAGDWVLVNPGPAPADPMTLTAVLPRHSTISRGPAGTGAAEQVLAANVDVAWIVHGLDTPLNPRRLERYLAAVWESGAVPEVVLTKADLAASPDEVAADVEAVAVGVTVLIVSTEDRTTVERLTARLQPARTYALLGPSGVGKSTLINLLADRTLAATGEVRDADRKGRHTTTRRELFQLSGGARSCWIRRASGNSASGRWTRASRRPFRKSTSWRRRAGSGTAGTSRSRGARSSRRPRRARSMPIAWPATANCSPRPHTWSASTIRKRRPRRFHATRRR